MKALQTISIFLNIKFAFIHVHLQCHVAYNTIKCTVLMLRENGKKMLIIMLNFIVKELTIKFVNYFN